MADKKYLSTDPNAGIEPKTEKVYLSTDPNAGVEPAPKKSFGGLVDNTGRNLKDLAYATVRAVNPIDALTGPGSGPLDTLAAIYADETGKSDMAFEEAARIAKERKAGTLQLPSKMRAVTDMVGQAGDYAYENPVTTAAMVIPPAGVAGREAIRTVPRAVRASGRGLDYMTATPGRSATLGGTVGALTTGTPVGAAAGAWAGLQTRGPMNRIARGLKLFRSGEKATPDEMPIPAGSGDVARSFEEILAEGSVPPARVPGRPSTPVARGMSEVGGPHYDDLVASDRMLQGMRAHETPTASFEEILGQGSTPPRIMPSKPPKTLKQGMGAVGGPHYDDLVASDEMIAGMTRAGEPGLKLDRLRSSRVQELSDLTEEFAKELPELSREELARIQRNMDLIMRKREP